MTIGSRAHNTSNDFAEKWLSSSADARSVRAGKRMRTIESSDGQRRFLGVAYIRSPRVFSANRQSSVPDTGDAPPRCLAHGTGIARTRGMDPVLLGRRACLGLLAAAALVPRADAADALRLGLLHTLSPAPFYVA